MANSEEIQNLTNEIKEKKIRLNILKRIGFFKVGSKSLSQKYATIEAHRRREEIRNLESKLLELKYEHYRNNNK